MTRTRNIPAIDAARERYRNNDTWSDYDSDIIHGDYRVDEVDGVMEVTELRAYQPGIATVDRLAGGSSAVTYYHTDMIGTTRFMTDGNGVIGEEATYTAFGEKVCSLPGGDCTNTTDHRYGYAGAFGYQSTINDTTGVADFPFLHVGHRYYDPGSGRFLQRDPIGIAGGLNVYGYVGNHPINWIDPSGLGPWKWIKDAATAVWEAVKTVVSPVDPTEHAADAAACMMADALRKHVLEDHPEDPQPQPKTCPACKKLTPKPPKNAPPGKGSPPAG